MSRFTKTINGRNVRYIKAKASLMDDEVDEAHDLFYLVKMPDEQLVTEPDTGVQDVTSSATQFENSNKDGQLQQMIENNECTQRSVIHVLPQQDGQGSNCFGMQ